MKRIILFIFVFSLFSVFVSAEERLPFGIHSYGSFKKIIATKIPDGVVDLEQALSGPHTYAVGELKNAEGEITDYDGMVLLNYGKDGIDTSTSEIPRGEQAMELITAQVEKWRELLIPKKMTDGELYFFVLEQARKSGINTKLPFPFLVDGNVKDAVWHVLSGAEVESNGKSKKLTYTKLVEYKDQAATVLVAFCSEVRDGFTRPGEMWHMHVVFKKEKTAGHIDAFVVEKGAKLLLPIR